MKIKNLLLLGLMAFGSMNASAADWKAGGLVFNVDATAKTATVVGIRTGYITASQKSIEIPATVTDGDGVVCKVTGFSTTYWTTANYTTSIGFETDNTQACTSMTINIDNFTNEPAAAQIPTSVTSLTIKGTSTIPNDFTVNDFTTTVTGLVTLDLSGLSAKAGKKVVFTAQGTSTALVTAKLPGIDVAANGFKNFTALKTVTGTKNIGDNAFDGCTALESIDLSKAETIGISAFAGTKIATADLSAAKTIGKDAFKDVAALKDVTFGKPLEKIGARAFSGTGLTVLSLSKCKNLTTANVIGDNAFPANAWTNIKLAGSQVNIAKIDLSGARESLKKLTISAAETGDLTDGLGNGLFAGFTALTTVQFAVDESGAAPVGITAIGDNAFGYDAVNKAYCSSLTSIEIPATVATIGAGAFTGSALTAISIPASVTLIDADAFAGCEALADLSFVAPEEGSSITMKINKRAFEGTAIAKVKLPSNVTKLGNDAFKDCKALKSFTADGLTAINASFDGCDNLKTVSIPATALTIADNAFKGLAKLATVTFGHNSADGDVLNSIGASAFEGCEALTAIDLSATALPDLGNANVFSGCTALATIELPSDPYVFTGNLGAGIFAGTAIAKFDAPYVSGTVDNLFGTSYPTDANTTLRTLKIGYLTGGTTILPSAFENCTALKNVLLGGANIGIDAFAYDTKLTTVEVTAWNSTQTIAAGAFDHCSALTTFTFQPSSPTEVPSDPNFSEDAFTGCTPFVQFNTTQYFVVEYPEAPVNATYASVENDVVKTVQDKANANQFIAKYANNTSLPVYINAKDAKVYSIYVDGEDAYFQACRTIDGKYWINPATLNHVIIKTDEAKEVKVTMDPTYTGTDTWPYTNTKWSVGFDDIYDSKSWDEDLSDLQAWWALDVHAGEYVYRLTNTDDQGFGFTFFTGKTVKEGQFFIKCTKKPEGAGRLNTIWLDEDGNVESEATAIQKIQNTDSENGAIYNLQGVRVQKAQKGLYIQNGKKYVVK